ncbi:hypothetical protein IEQ34_002058 [Dendrobium chrysotoxum]|uniref:PiggyBac transposable element-derived protein domain-containing protein n=1 Tax=Dendrobium chrysotoxum TaxID=161865 RepID=A0AAV7HIJ5_DENCH|nr:hypothetical protein IEQ34_002058 [Dendrobium chrysotoxum]
MAVPVLNLLALRAVGWLFLLLSSVQSLPIGQRRQAMVIIYLLMRTWKCLPGLVESVFLLIFSLVRLLLLSSVTLPKRHPFSRRPAVAAASYLAISHLGTLQRPADVTQVRCRDSRRDSGVAGRDSVTRGAGRSAGQHSGGQASSEASRPAGRRCREQWAVTRAAASAMKKSEEDELRMEISLNDLDLFEEMEETEHVKEELPERTTEDMSGNFSWEIPCTASQYPVAVLLGIFFHDNCSRYFIPVPGIGTNSRYLDIVNRYRYRKDIGKANRMFIQLRMKHMRCITTMVRVACNVSIRKEHHSYWPNSRKIKSKDFVCLKAGFKKDIDLNSNSKYQKSNTITGCPTMVRFSMGEDGV